MISSSGNGATSIVLIVTDGGLSDELIAERQVHMQPSLPCSQLRLITLINRQKIYEKWVAPL